MKRGLLIRGGFAAVIALSVLGATTASAGACENEVRFTTDTNTPRVAKAEKALNEGRYQLAAVGILQVFPNIRKASPTENPLTSRALRIMALAAIRTDGELTAGKQWRGTTAEEKNANIEWAITKLRSIHMTRGSSPAARTDLGEALAKVDKHRDEALKLLGHLAEKDLMTTPYGYAALGKLRGAAGDKTGAEAALKRCEAMTKTPAICRPTTVPSA